MKTHISLFVFVSLALSLAHPATAMEEQEGLNSQGHVKKKRNRDDSNSEKSEESKESEKPKASEEETVSKKIRTEEPGKKDSLNDQDVESLLPTGGAEGLTIQDAEEEGNEGNETAGKVVINHGDNWNEVVKRLPIFDKRPVEIHPPDCILM